MDILLRVAVSVINLKKFNEKLLIKRASEKISDALLNDNKVLIFIPIPVY